MDNRNIKKAITRGLVNGIPINYLNSLKISDKKNKRFQIKYNNKIIHFGLWPYKNGTYIDHNDNDIRKNWIKRHNTNKYWNDPRHPIFWATYTLW